MYWLESNLRTYRFLSRQWTINKIRLSVNIWIWCQGSGLGPLVWRWPQGMPSSHIYIGQIMLSFSCLAFWTHFVLQDLECISSNGSLHHLMAGLWQHLLSWSPSFWTFYCLFTLHFTDPLFNFKSLFLLLPPCSRIRNSLLPHHSEVGIIHLPLKWLVQSLIVSNSGERQ